jgi:hypothetical protein
MPGPGGAPYVTQSQLASFWPAASFVGVTVPEQTQACIDATSEADSYLLGRYQMPLLAWGADLTMRTAHIAIYRLLSTRGFSAQGGADQQLVLRYYEAVGNPTIPGHLGWFQKVQRQAIHPDITATVPSDQSPTFNLPQVLTGVQRGWQCRNGRTPGV